MGKRTPAKKRKSLTPANTPADALAARSARPHGLTITFSAVAILLTSIGLYWAIAQPDIRYIPKVSPETLSILESKVDDSGNLVYSVRMNPKFTNFSFKPGFIDKVEFAPHSIATVPDIRVTGIQKSPIFWNQEKNIELTFLVSIPADPANHLNSKRELAIDEILLAFDNTGKKVERLPNGLFGRIRFMFKQTVDIQLIRE